MIRIETSPRFERRLETLGPEIRAKAQEQLTAVQRGFGDPHHHGGLGLRKLGRRSYEVRLSLELRIVLMQGPDSLMAWDIMDHDEVRRWLKRRKGD